MNRDNRPMTQRFHQEPTTPGSKLRLLLRNGCPLSIMFAVLAGGFPADEISRAQDTSDRRDRIGGYARFLSRCRDTDCRRRRTGLAR